MSVSTYGFRYPLCWFCFFEEPWLTIPHPHLHASGQHKWLIFPYRVVWKRLGLSILNGLETKVGSPISSKNKNFGIPTTFSFTTWMNEMEEALKDGYGQFYKVGRGLTFFSSCVGEDGRDKRRDRAPLWPWKDFWFFCIKRRRTQES